MSVYRDPQLAKRELQADLLKVVDQQGYITNVALWDRAYECCFYHHEAESWVSEVLQPERVPPQKYTRWVKREG